MEVMAARELERCIDRLAFEISERMGSPSTYVLVGIVTGGDALARRLAARIGASEGAEPQVGSLDITLYRDDLYTGLEKPVLGETRIPFALDGKRVVLVDDVLFTGRTVRAALDELMDYGRPRFIQLAVLIDRGGRQLPIQPDYTGRVVNTLDVHDKVVVHLKGGEGDRVEIQRRKEAR